MSLAKSYARALYEAAVETKVDISGLDRLGAGLLVFALTIDSHKEARVALCGPATSSREKMSIVEELCRKFGFPDLLSRFLSLMARKGRVDQVSEVAGAFQVVRLLADGGVLGSLVSADRLEPSDSDSLAQAFSRKLGKKVSFKTSVDSSLLAGVKVTVGGVTYDGTLRAQIHRLRDRLVYGAPGTDRFS